MATVTATLAADPASSAVGLRPENRVKGLDLFALPRVGVDVAFSPDCTGDFPFHLQQTASAKPYAYVAGNPLNATDPSGECGLWGDDTCASEAAAAAAAAWKKAQDAASAAADTATHLCIRTGGGDYNSNTNNGCQTRLSGKQGLIGVVGAGIVGVGVVVTATVGTAVLATSAAIDTSTLAGTGEWLAFWAHAPFVLALGPAMMAGGGYMVGSAFASTPDAPQVSCQ